MKTTPAMRTEYYGGESPAKKLARNAVWVNARLALGERFRSSRFLVLSGPEAADVRAIRALGGDPARVVCVDQDPVATEAALAVEPRSTFVTSSVLSAARDFRRAFDCVVLDYCSQLGPRSIADFARTLAWTARDGAFVVGAFSYGREVGCTASAIKAASDFPVDTVDYLYLDALGERVHGATSRPERFDAPNARWRMFLNEGHRAFSSVGLRYVPHVSAYYAYASRTREKVGTPMLYALGVVTRRCARRELGVGSRASKMLGTAYTGSFDEMVCRVRDHAVEVARLYGSRTAADAMNLSTGQVAAWLATATRENRQPSIDKEVMDAFAGMAYVESRDARTALSALRSAYWSQHD